MSTTQKPRRSKKAAPRPPSKAKHRAAKRDPAIDEYLAQVTPSSRSLLRQLRKTIHSLVPDVEECISYRLPAFRHRGRVVAGFSATASGCSYYPFSGKTLSTLAADIAGYGHTKSALHFAADNPLPRSLVEKLLAARMAEGAPRKTSKRA